MTISRWRWSVRLGVLLMALAGGVRAESEARADGVAVKGAFFARTVNAGEQVLDLQGAGLLRYKRIIPVYAAALYMAPADRGHDVLGNVTKRLEVEYLVKAEARDFNAEGDRILRENLAPETYASLRERLDQIDALYPDPKPGDRCSLTYHPDRGTELMFNGTVLGVIPGEDFQRAYFSIWLGEQPASPSLRAALLGAERG